MQISMSNNPIDRLSCYIHNKKEDLSGVIWRKGKQKTIKCRICGNILDSHKEQYSPMQCGWHKVSKYSWICHMCFDHRNFKPFIEMVDETDEKVYEERHRRTEQIKLKAQEVIDLLKEYLPEYKEVLDTYDSYYDLQIFEDGDFYFTIGNDEIVLDIASGWINEVIVKQHPLELNPVVKFYEIFDCTSWDDTIEFLKKEVLKKKGE